jgi:aldose 1-epimerase
MDDFTLEPADAQWATETLARANEELKNTAPGGRLFAETVSVLTEREKNWVRWKADMCKEFEKGRFRVEIEMEDDQDTTIKPENDEYVGENEATNKQKRKRMVGLEEATKKVRLELSQPPEEWIYRLGSEPLTEIWDMGYRDLSDLQTPFQLRFLLPYFECWDFHTTVSPPDLAMSKTLSRRSSLKINVLICGKSS